MTERGKGIVRRTLSSGGGVRADATRHVARRTSVVRMLLRVGTMAQCRSAALYRHRFRGIIPVPAA
jgi:hypothetical protein